MGSNRTSVMLAIVCGIMLCCINNSQAQAFYSPLDSQLVAASNVYNRSAVFAMIFGSNYRKDWRTPVKMQRLDITKQSLTLVALKGGFESISMNMVTRDSVQMVLRTVDKNLDKLMPKWLKHTPIHTITQDIISSSEPYAAFTVPVMCDALGLVHTNPSLYYVNDPAFGKYQPLFAGKVCLLEERIPVRPGTKHEEMDAPFTMQQRDNHCVVMQQTLLKARLLDMLFGDWDRHPGQWNWGSFDSAGKKYIYPVPVDRDMVYFNSNGLFLKFIRLWSIHYMRGFKSKIKKLYQFNYKSRDFDRELFNGLDRDDWDKTIREVQYKLNDSVIDIAVNQLPPEILAFRGDEIKQKMKSRRDGLYPAAMKYYARLAKHIYIMASDKPDLFSITANNDGTEIAVYNTGTATDEGKIYHRTLDKKTKRVYLVGITDNDKTELPPHTGVKVKIITTANSNIDKYNVRARNLKKLGKSVNNLGQPGYKK